MPAQQRLRCHESMVSALRGEHPGQCRQDGAVRPDEAWPGHLSAQARDLVSQHEDLGVLGRLAAGEQCEPTGEVIGDEVQQP